MSRLLAPSRRRSIYRQISALSFVLGGLLAAAMYTSSKVARSGTSAFRPGFPYTYFTERAENKVAKDSEEIQKLREDRKQLEDIIAHGNDGKRALNESLQEAREYAGLTEVAGPGVVITLQDSKRQRAIGVPPENYLIHDRDINEVINELRSSGAEAIAVGGQRVVSSTAVRCVGPVAMVNDVKIGSPFVIRAIGDPDTLLGAMKLSNGVLDNIRKYDPTMVRSEKAALLRLPAFSGNTQRKWSHTVNAR